MTYAEHAVPHLTPAPEIVYRKMRGELQHERRKLPALSRHSPDKMQSGDIADEHAHLLAKRLVAPRGKSTMPDIKPTRRAVLIGAASIAAVAALPVATIVPAAVSA